MAESKTERRSSHNWTRVSVIPFTGGIIVFVYAFFWPESYGNWLGTIVRAFRTASGL